MEYCYNCMYPVDEPKGICPHCGKPLDFECPAHQLKPGTLLQGRYLVGKALGQGGFGITYIGRDTTLNMRVAIKEFYPNGYSNRNHDVTNNVTITASDQDGYFRNGKQKFLNEARVLAMFCGEPGIVGVRDFFAANNTAYIVMDYVDGVTLKKYVAKKGPIAADTVFRIMQPVMKTLMKVHEQGVIHRDISPDNIMVLRDGSLKLLDFGSAREVGGDKSLSVMLKPGYAPEEQYRSTGHQGPWTDVYALCATMYFCLTGNAPEEAIERIWSGNANTPAPSECGSNSEAWQDAVIMRGLSVRAEDRYQSIKELSDAMTFYPSETIQHDYTISSDHDKTVYQGKIENDLNEAATDQDDFESATTAKTKDTVHSTSEKSARYNRENEKSSGESKKKHKILPALIIMFGLIAGIILVVMNLKSSGNDSVGIYSITLTAVSDSKEYDGTPLKNDTVKSTRLASEDHTMTADYIVYDEQGRELPGDPTEIGVYTKKVSNVQILSGNRDITAQYEIETIDGTLTITEPKPVATAQPNSEKDSDTAQTSVETITSSVSQEDSSAERMGPFRSGKFYFVNGASIQIPQDFSDINTSGDYRSGMDVDGYIYVFYNSEYEMSITLTEAKISAYINKGYQGRTSHEVMMDKREKLIESRGTPSWKSYDQTSFRLTGYSGGSIYYTYAALDNDVLYLVDFLYPGTNRNYCDRIVEVTEASFTGADESRNMMSGPSPVDLDAINADIVYPHSNSMYLDTYKVATVKPSTGKTAVYAFKDPDSKNNVMRDGNYFTVTKGTEVTVLAESSGYSCVIINNSQKAGWINSDFIVEKT